MNDLSLTYNQILDKQISRFFNKMSTYFSISASNVTFTESYNYGIVKAGDAGSGARGRDGVGGSDTSNNSSPGNGTSGGLAGTAGSPGIAYLHGQLNEEEDTEIELFDGRQENQTQENQTANSDKVFGNIDPVAGSRGNDGYGGLNLIKLDFAFSRDIKHDWKRGTQDYLTIQTYENGNLATENSLAKSITAGFGVNLFGEHGTFIYDEQKVKCYLQLDSGRFTPLGYANFELNIQDNEDLIVYYSGKIMSAFWTNYGRTNSSVSLLDSQTDITGYVVGGITNATYH